MGISQQIEHILAYNIPFITSGEAKFFHQN